MKKTSRRSETKREGKREREKKKKERSLLRRQSKTKGQDVPVLLNAPVERGKKRIVCSSVMRRKKKKGKKRRNSLWTKVQGHATKGTGPVATWGAGKKGDLDFSKENTGPRGAECL